MSETAGATADATPEELQKLLDEALAARDMLAVEKEALTLERETLRDSLASVSAEKATAEETIARNARALETVAAEREALRESLVFVTAEKSALEMVYRREAQGVTDKAQADIAAAILERDEARFELRRDRADVTIEVAQRFVDRLELPWDGPEALVSQLDALLARLKAAEGKAP